MSDFDTLVAFLALLAAVAVVLVLRGQMTLSISRRPKPPAPKGDGGNA